MAAKLERLVAHWLHKLQVPVSATFLNEKLRSHSDFPSLLSITDTLDELGIDNAAIEVDKEKLKDVPTPFLAHTNVKGGDFVLVQNIAQTIKKDPEFEKKWDGVVLLAEKPEAWKLEENEKAIRKGRKQKYILIITIAVIVLLAGTSLLPSFSWMKAGLMITAIAGLAVAILIVQHELGISNEMTEKLCSEGKNTDCDAVIKSKGSKLSKWFNWADVGIVYYSTTFLLLIISNYTLAAAAFINGFSLLAICSMLFTFFSIYYQWRVVKKWCLLCLATVGLLWIQFILLLAPALSLAKGSAYLSLNIGLLNATAFLAVAFVWLQIIKPVLQKNKKLVDKHLSLLRFKNNPAIFKVLLQQQRKVDITQFKHDLQLGNPNSPVQIIVACNPYCRPCAKTHEELHQLIERIDAGLTVRFTIKTENKEDRKFQVVQYILQMLHDKSTAYKRRVLHDWYLQMDFENFSSQYPLGTAVDIVDINEQLEEHEQWTEKCKIAFTPTIFINGYQLPKEYKATELMRLLRGVTGKMEEQETNNELMLA